MKMRKFTLILTCYGMAFQMGFAQELPKWANKARKAVFSVVTYDKDNQILNTGNGFFIDENGTAVSDYTLFKGAERAVVVTAEGKELPVEYILGANDMYDVVKFKTAYDKKIEALQPTSRPGTVNETVYVLPYSTQKAPTGTHGTIAKIDTISHNSFYYTLNMKTGDKTVSCPVIGAMSAFVLTTMLEGIPLIYSSQEVAYPRSLNFFNYGVIDLKSNEVFAQEMAEIIRAYKATSSVRGGELEVYTTGDVASFYRAAGSHGMLVMVNTANESVQVKVPMEHAGKTMTDVIAGVDVELPTVMTMEPYQYFIYQQ